MFLRQKRGAMSYEDRLKTLNWQTLESRRQRLICSIHHLLRVPWTERKRQSISVYVTVR